jgi:hypothetical protein
VRTGRAQLQDGRQPLGARPRNPVRRKEGFREATRGVSIRGELLAQTKLPNDVPIFVLVLPQQIPQQTRPSPHERQQTTPGRKIMIVHTKVARKLPDPLGQQSDLHLRGARVGVVHPKLLNNLLFPAFIHPYPNPQSNNGRTTLCRP